MFIFPAIITVLFVIAVVALILVIVPMTENSKSFMIPAALVLALFRVIWVLFKKLCVKLMLGYNLDNSFQETHTAWSIMKLPCMVSAKKLIYGDNIVKKEAANDEIELKRRENLVIKYSKVKQVADLVFEINRVKQLVSELNSELVYLENMKFSQTTNESVRSVVSSISSNSSVTNINHNKSIDITCAESAGSIAGTGSVAVSSRGLSGLILNVNSAENSDFLSKALPSASRYATADVTNVNNLAENVVTSYDDKAEHLTDVDHTQNILDDSSTSKRLINNKVLPV